MGVIHFSRYRRKPQVVEAIQVTAYNSREVEETMGRWGYVVFFGESYGEFLSFEANSSSEWSDKSIRIGQAAEGCFLVRDEHEDVTVFAPGDFYDTYEPIEDGSL